MAATSSGWICEKNLEGIVAKHRDSCYDARAKWIKIKNPAYTQSERRHELFEKSKPGVESNHVG